MPSKERQVNYETTNTYSTLNKLTSKTEYIWVACHGIAYLSRYFIKYFEVLDSDKNFVIAPQAPAKYYQTKAFKYVGASWLTRENKAIEIENVLNYLDAVYEKEKLQDKKVILLGYSQGVSIVMRWLQKRNVNCERLILHSGSIPNEFTPEDFVNNVNTKTHLVYGNSDQYIHSEKLKKQIDMAQKLFPENLEIHEFDGKHEVSQEVLKKIDHALIASKTIF
ncbi:MAG: alpha/beta hydrolase [Psychroflexus halocasei]